MPIIFDVQTNIEDCDLSFETCSQIINMLQESYQSIRKEMYSYFLGKKSLKSALIIAGFFFALYAISNEIIFAYVMPVSVIFVLILSVSSAEYLTSQSRKQLHVQIQRYIQKRERLLKNQNLKA